MTVYVPAIKHSPFSGRKSLDWQGKGEGTCKQGETAANTGCTPASGEASSNQDTSETPEKNSKKPKAKKAKSVGPDGVITNTDAILNMMADQFEKKVGWQDGFTREGFIKNWKKTLKKTQADPQAAEDIAAVVRSAYSKFDIPQVPIVVRKPTDDDKAVGENAHWDNGFMVILDDALEERKYHSSKKPLNSDRKGTVKESYDDPIEGLVVHELGHKLHNDDESTLQRARSVIVDPVERKQVRNLISDYAASNPQEMVAEAYAMRKHPDFDSLSTEAKDLILKILGEKSVDGSQSIKPSPFADRKSLTWQVKTAGPHKFGCVMLLPPLELRNEILNWSLENIPDFHLGIGGREADIHVTLKYGFLDSSRETLERIKALLSGVGPITGKLQGFSLFKGNEDGDVLKIDVESAELNKWNKIISEEFPCYDKYPDYLPHITIAYLTPEASQLYLEESPEFLHKPVVFTEAYWGSADGYKERWTLSQVVPGTKGVKGRWVTMPAGGHGGTHVYLDNAGNIEKGPAGTTGKKPDELKKKPKKVEHPKVKPSHLKNPEDTKPVVPKVEEAPKTKPETNTPKNKPKTTESKKKLGPITKEAQPELSEDETSVLSSYTASAWINDELRGRELRPTAAYVPDWRKEEVRKLLPEAFKKVKPMKNPTQVYRGMYFDSPEEKADFLSKLTDGTEVTWPGYVSTSPNESAASGYAVENGIQLNIEAIRGLDLGNYGEGDNGGELLLDHNSKFVVLKNQTEDGKTIVTLRQVK